MTPLPHEIVAYKKTPEFTQETVPAGLLKNHQTKEGVWGEIIILSGKLEYVISEPVLEAIILTPELSGVIEPQVLHHIALLGGVRFYIEFSR